MITGISINNFKVNSFNSNLKAEKSNAQLLSSPVSDTFTFTGAKRKTTGASDFPKEIGISELSKIYDTARTVIDEVYDLFKQGEFTAEDGSRVQILDLPHTNSKKMYEYSSDIEPVRTSTFKNGKLEEIRIPLESKSNEARTIIIRPYEDGKSVKLFEIKHGIKSGEGRIETMITFDKNGCLNSFMG